MRRKLKVKVRTKIRKQRVLFFRRVFIAFFATGLFIAATVWAKNKISSFLNSDYFSIKEVALIGLSSVNADELKIYFEGTANKQSIWFVNFRETIAAVKEKYPRIKAIEIKKNFPDKIKVIFAERTPVAIVRENDKDYAIDESGVKFEPTHDEASVMPVIDDYAALQLPVILSFMKMVGEIKPELRKAISTIKVEGSAVKTRVGDMTEIYWGETKEKSELARKIALFDVVYEDAAERFGKISYIDLTDFKKNKRAVVLPLNKKI